MKLKERVNRLEQNNASLFYKNQAFNREFSALKHDLFVLQDENEKLKKEQQEFQDELKKEIDKIKAMKRFNRFWASLKLLWSLINTIEQGFKE